MRHNAMKFGLYAKALPGESEAEHSAYVQDLRDELKPHGAMQEVLFFQIVEDHFALKRLSLASHAYLLFNWLVFS